jgi:nitrogenase subunit NifH
MKKRLLTLYSLLGDLAVGGFDLALTTGFAQVKI